MKIAFTNFENMPINTLHQYLTHPFLSTIRDLLLSTDTFVIGLLDIAISKQVHIPLFIQSPKVGNETLVCSKTFCVLFLSIALRKKSFHLSFARILMKKTQELM